jgi:hypothetical protein
MKKTYFLFILIGLTAIACSPSSTETSEETESEATVAGYYGDTEWENEESISLASLMDSLQLSDSIYTTVEGKIDAACQAKGCWMSMSAAENEIFVKFKDYGFFVPMNSAGHDATMRGWAYAESQSVADQIEYAKDAEASDEEIAKITEPIRKYTFTADGVVIK